MADRVTPCFKIAYPDEPAARQAADGQRRSGRIVRPYRCPHCPAWHLTTFSRDKQPRPHLKHSGRSRRWKR